MKNKLLNELKEKIFQIPINFNELECDKYEFDDKELKIYKNNDLIKKIWYHENGKLVYEWNYKDGKLEGKQYKWYDNGKFRYERNYKDGNYDGKQYTWYDDGKLWYEWNFENGKLIKRKYYEKENKIINAKIPDIVENYKSPDIEISNVEVNNKVIDGKRKRRTKEEMRLARENENNEVINEKEKLDELPVKEKRKRRTKEEMKMFRENYIPEIKEKKGRGRPKGSKNKSQNL